MRIMYHVVLRMQIPYNVRLLVVTLRVVQRGTAQCTRTCVSNLRVKCPCAKCPQYYLVHARDTSLSIKCHEIRLQGVLIVY